MVMPLGDRKWAVHHQPMDQVGDLADTPADTGSCFPETEFHTRQVTLALVRMSYQLAEGESLTGSDEDTTDVFDGDLQVHDLIPLQLHVAFTQLADEHRLVLFHFVNERLAVVDGCIGGAACIPLHISKHPAIPYRQKIKDGVHLADEFTLGHRDILNAVAFGEIIRLTKIYIW